MNPNNIIAVLFFGMLAISLHAETVEQLKKALADKEQEIRTLMLATPEFKEKMRQALTVEKQIDTQAPGLKSLKRELRKMELNVCLKEENDPTIKELNKKIKEIMREVPKQRQELPEYKQIQESSSRIHERIYEYERQAENAINVTQKKYFEHQIQQLEQQLKEFYKKIKQMITPASKELDRLYEQKKALLDIDRLDTLAEQVDNIAHKTVQQDLWTKQEDVISEALDLIEHNYPQLQRLIEERFQLTNKLSFINWCFYLEEKPEGILVGGVVIPYSEIEK